MHKNINTTIGGFQIDGNYDIEQWRTMNRRRKPEKRTRTCKGKISRSALKDIKRLSWPSYIFKEFYKSAEIGK